MGWHPSSRMPAFVLVVMLLALGACERSPSGIQSIAPAELAERIEKGTSPIILDVRTRDEYAAGHIPGAVNIPHDELAERLGELPAAKSNEIVVHCQRGGRAGSAEETLSAAGYQNLRDLDGHMQVWLQNGLPVE